MAVDLLIRIARGEDDRFSGTVQVNNAPDVRRFSGTLELMRVFEDLVPVDDGWDDTDVPSHTRVRP